MQYIKELKEIEIGKMMDPVILVVKEKEEAKAIIYEYSKGPDTAAVFKRNSFYKIKNEIQEQTNLKFVPRTKSDSKNFYGCWIR